MSDDDTAILEVRGKSVAAIAKLFKTTPQAVNKILDGYAAELLAEPNLKRTLLLELTRLDRITRETSVRRGRASNEADVLIKDWGPPENSLRSSAEARLLHRCQ